MCKQPIAESKVISFQLQKVKLLLPFFVRNVECNLVINGFFKLNVYIIKKTFIIRLHKLLSHTHKYKQQIQQNIIAPYSIGSVAFYICRRIDHISFEQNSQNSLTLSVRRLISYSTNRIRKMLVEKFGHNKSLLKYFCSQPFQNNFR